jgi:proline iminopeptidase
MRRKLVVLIGLIGVGLIAAGCRERGLTPHEGTVTVRGGRIWYRIVGSGTRTPLLLIHGGPGAPSYYLKSLAALGDERPVIFYDQLGAGRSDHPADTSLWHLSLYVERLGELRRALGLKEVHLLGHSFGTMVAVDYMLTKPEGVRSLILAGPVLSSARWFHDQDSLRRTLPDSIQRILAEHERDHTTRSPAYMAAQMEFMKRYQSRADPWPPELDSTAAAFMRDTVPSQVMFRPRGEALSYDRTDRLGEITVPTLFTIGRYDRSTPATTGYYQSLIPGSELVIFEHSAHLPMIDESTHYVAVVRDFLDRVDEQ